MDRTLRFRKKYQFDPDYYHVPAEGEEQLNGWLCAGQVHRLFDVPSDLVEFELNLSHKPLAESYHVTRIEGSSHIRLDVDHEADLECTEDASIYVLQPYAWILCNEFDDAVYVQLRYDNEPA